MKTALLLIDVQNDYGADGKFAQFNVEQVVQNIADYTKQAEQDGKLLIAVQHFLPEQAGMFVKDTHGGDIHASLKPLLNGKPHIAKAYADCFQNTNLNDILQENGIEQLEICGMMTQNCVTHTALSPFAKSYKICVISNACTAPSEIIHQIAIGALSEKEWVEVI